MERLPSSLLYNQPIPHKLYPIITIPKPRSNLNYNKPNPLQMTQTSLKPIKITYNIIDRSARKIITLVRIANLNYEIEQNHQDVTNPHILYTPSGELYNEYEIIHYIIEQSRELSRSQAKAEEESGKGEHVQGELVQGGTKEGEHGKVQGVVNLEGADSYITAKMYERLYELRRSLFPLLQEFYKYLTGNEKTKKSKYDSLMNKIKKDIGALDNDINDHPEIYHSEFNFLNIIIACEVYMACKFVFEEKFRNSKYALFNKYEKISRRTEFTEIHGKSDLCQKEYLPSEFEQDGPVHNETKQNTIPTQIVKMSSNILSAHADSNRNELLYNYFKSTFSQTESKKQYFPYFWLMFEDLNCILMEIVQNVEDNQQDNGNLKLKALHKKIVAELNPEIDYGIIGLYKSEKDKKTIIRGLICIGSKSGQQFESGLQKDDPIDVKFHKVDTSSEKEKKEVQKLWEQVEENSVQDQIRLTVILHI